MSIRLGFGIVLGVLSAALSLMYGAALMPAAAGVDQRNDAVYPPQSIPILFSHQRHLALGVGCVLCHSAIEDSVVPMGAPFPNHDQCGLCHLMNLPDVSKLYPKATCDACHENYIAGEEPARIMASPANLSFAHKTHIEAGIECTTCHVNMEQVTIANTQQLPRMKECVSCHDKRRISTACITCHPAFNERLLTDQVPAGFMPSGAQMPDDHSLEWLNSHGVAARMDPQRCMACHGQNRCLDCHDAVGKPDKVHPGDWILLHPRRARSAGSSCQSCHRTESFCADCHRAVGLHSADPLQPGGLGVHPPGWVDLPITREHHRFAAQRNITQCSACHEVDSCGRCHSTLSFGGFGVTPHGPGFKAERLYKRNPASCWSCHSVDDPLLTTLGEQ